MKLLSEVFSTPVISICDATATIVYLNFTKFKIDNIQIQLVFGLYSDKNIVQSCTLKELLYLTRFNNSHHVKKANIYLFMQKCEKNPGECEINCVHRCLGPDKSQPVVNHH